MLHNNTKHTIPIQHMKFRSTWIGIQFKQNRRSDNQRPIDRIRKTKILIFAYSRTTLANFLQMCQAQFGEIRILENNKGVPVDEF